MSDMSEIGGVVGILTLANKIKSITLQRNCDYKM